MLEDIHAFVAFAEAGSVARAADRLYRTPSAVTRQIQRLEAALSAELLNRTVKPPRLTPLGTRVLEQARELLAGMETLKHIASNNSDPSGLLRIGVSHALAEGALAKPVQIVRERYPKVRLRLLSDLTAILLDRLVAGELDLAVVVMPEDHPPPGSLQTKIIARDRMVIVRPARGVFGEDWRSMAGRPWVLNPPGCMLRASLLNAMESAGTSATIGAEVHNMHLQLSLVASGYGYGLLPERFVRREAPADLVEVVRPRGFDLRMAIVLVRSGPLGALDHAAADFERGLSGLSLTEGN